MSDSVQLISDSVQLMSHSVQLMGHSVQLMGHSVQLVGHSVQLMGHSVQLMGHSVQLMSDSVQIMSHSVQLMSHSGQRLHRRHMSAHCQGPAKMLTLVKTKLDARDSSAQCYHTCLVRMRKVAGLENHMCSTRHLLCTYCRAPTCQGLKCVEGKMLCAHSHDESGKSRV